MSLDQRRIKLEDIWNKKTDDNKTNDNKTSDMKNNNYEKFVCFCYFCFNKSIGKSKRTYMSVNLFLLLVNLIYNWP
jgi:hypothetical protein